MDMTGHVPRPPKLSGSGPEKVARGGKQNQGCSGRGGRAFEWLVCFQI